jgi:hypothetical protein
VHHHRDKPWLQSLYVPYIIVFILAASVSLLSVAVKWLLFVGKLRTRAKHMSVKRVSRLSLGGVQVRESPRVPPSTPEYPGHGFRLVVCRSRPSLRRIGK